MGWKFYPGRHIRVFIITDLASSVSKYENKGQRVFIQLILFGTFTSSIFRLLPCSIACPPQEFSQFLVFHIDLIRSKKAITFSIFEPYLNRCHLANICSNKTMFARLLPLIYQLFYYRFNLECNAPFLPK